jgi:trimeric autotransporter adhesin
MGSTIATFKFASLALIASLASLNVFAQLTLTGTSYTQNFDAIGSGLPTGWTVSTSATASTLGTTASFVTTQATWASTTDAFRNVASSNIAFSSSTTNQGLDTNRALGWRPISAATRDGAITLMLTNTTGFTNFSLGFDLFTTNDVSGAQTYVFEYRVGSSGSFTQLGSTYTTSGSGATDFGSVSYSFISSDFAGLNNQSSEVYFRVRGTGSGSGNLDTIAIDNFSLTYSAVPEPATYAFFGGLAALGLAGAKRLRSRRLKSTSEPTVSA